jgi:putative ABC transport system permease protein
MRPGFFSMLDLLSLLNDTLYDGLPYALICLSFVLTAKYIRFPDVTCSGSFVFGAAIAAIAIVRAGLHPVVAVVLAAIGGAAAGALTGFFFTVLRLDRLLAGILSAFVLYSVNLMLLTPTLAYGNHPTLFSWFEDRDRLIVLANTGWHPWVIGLLLIVVVGAKIVLDRFLRSEVGLAMRCLEDEQAGEYALERHGLAPSRLKLLALCLGNAIVAVTGALVSFKEGAANAQRGFDVLITGLVAFLLGEQLLKLLQRIAPVAVTPWTARLRPTSGAILGGIAYFALMTISQRLHVASEFTKIALVALVALSAAPTTNIVGTLLRRRRPAERSGGAESLLGVESLAFKYPSADKDSLQEVSFTVRPGQVLQLAGGNGVGKTTALRLVAGFLDAQERGRILFKGVDLTGDRHERLKRIAYVDQSADRGVVGCLTTQENLALAAMGSQPSAWRAALRPGTVAHVARVLDRSPFGPEVLGRRADQLSGGQRQVLNLLTLLAKRDLPELVLLDEPTNNLDAGNTERCRRIIQTLHDAGAAIVIVSHARFDGIAIDRVVDVPGASLSDPVIASGKDAAEQ